MDDSESQGLLKSWLGFLARKQPERSTKPASLQSRAREAWLRTDAFLQHDSDELGDDPEGVGKALRALENYIQDDSDPEADSVSALDIRQSSSLSASQPSNTRLRSRAHNMVCRTRSFRRCAEGWSIRVVVRILIQAQSFASANGDEKRILSFCNFRIWRQRSAELSLVKSQILTKSQILGTISRTPMQTSPC